MVIALFDVRGVSSLNPKPETLNCSGLGGWDLKFRTQVSGLVRGRRRHFFRFHCW